MYSSGNRKVNILREPTAPIHLDVLQKTKDPSEPRALTTPSCPGTYHPLRGASQSAGDMKFTDDGTIAILSPTEMREARHLCGWTLATLSRYAEISIAQLSTYENGLNGLRADQVRLCMELLLGASQSEPNKFKISSQPRNKSGARRYRPTCQVRANPARVNRISVQSDFIRRFPRSTKFCSSREPVCS
jgi:transcriptional regulator with XRE-family HTH domain